MLFITAGMGKGTGTGAAPVVAEIAKEMGILTIAVVTMPFRFEGAIPATYAEAGITELKKHVDSLIVIKNQNIIKCYNDEEVDKAFGYVDDVLKNAVKCIAELITVNLEQNIDFNDINSILKNSGSAMLGVAEASGENRIKDVLFGVLRCPLLTEEHVTGAKNFLFSISYGSEQKLRISELQQLTECFEKLNSRNSHVIWGRNEDPTLGAKIKLSVIISNYSTNNNKEFSSIGELQSMFEDEKREGSFIVDKGSDIFTSEVKPLTDNDFHTPKNEIKDFDFLNKDDFGRTGSHVAKPEFAEMQVDAGFLSGPQMIRSTYEPKYEDDNQFAFLIDKPAVLRERQENKEDFQDKALQHNHAPSFMRNDLADFFNNLPD
jgi:cell division protein FtsZ